MHYVYRHIRLDKNEPFYIGIGSDKSFLRAYSKKSRNPYWHNIVKFTPYRVDIVFKDLTYEEACAKEKEFISLYGRGVIGMLCNITEGGEGMCNPTEEIRRKISEAKKGYKNPQFGKTWSPEKRQTMLNRMSGFNNPNYRKTISEKQKLRISLAQKGRKKSDVEKEAIYSKTRKRVIDSETGIIYPSINDAAVAFNVPAYTISRWVRSDKKNLELL
jgi:group I intron endonuclease